MNDLGVAFGAVAGVLSLALFLCLVNERVCEFVIKPVVEAILKTAKRPVGDAAGVMPYLAAVTGFAISFGFGLDLFAPLAEAVGLHPAAWVTQALTAVVVAGGSNLLHDLWPGGGATVNARR